VSVCAVVCVSAGVCVYLRSPRPPVRGVEINVTVLAFRWTELSELN